METVNSACWLLDIRGEILNFNYPISAKGNILIST